MQSHDHEHIGMHIVAIHRRYRLVHGLLARPAKTPERPESIPRRRGGELSCDRDLGLREPEVPRDLAIDWSPCRATAITPRRNSLGNGLGTVPTERVGLGQIIEPGNVTAPESDLLTAGRFHGLSQHS